MVPPAAIAAAAQADAPPPAGHPVPRLEVAPCPTADVARLERELGVSGVVAQVLCRRGLGDPAAARAFLAADERHDPSRLAGMAAAVDLVLGHVARGSRIVVHGDYDVDGVCSTAIAVGALRVLGADVDWYLPSRADDGYGLGAATVERLAARGTGLLVTVDCGITAVDEVAAARAGGMDVLVTDHHAPRADGVLPAAPIVHPALGGYPCPDLCAAGVAHKLAAALLAGAGRDPVEADGDLDLVALATVADVVALRGENRRLVRQGLRALAATRRPGLRALMRVARVDPARLDATAVGFRLAPRINAAGRLARADAGLELLLTEDVERATAVAEELDAVNADRRHVEQRILWAAEAQVAEQGDRAAYVLAGEDWHPGVVGIVASRIAERHHRPVVLVALDADVGTGSGRSVPGFDLLAALHAGAEHLLRHGGHRAAAGLEVRRDQLEGFRAAFTAHAEEHLTEELRAPVQRVDAVVAGDELGLPLCEELRALEPFGQGNPPVSLLVPAATLRDPRPMGEGRHVRFTLDAGATRARGVLFGCDGRLPCDADAPVDAVVRLEVDEWNGAAAPRVLLRSARPCRPGPVALVGEPDDAWDALEGCLPPALPGSAAMPAADRDRRGGGIAGIIAALVASGERVLVVSADAVARARHLHGRLGGFDLCSHAALSSDPALADAYEHLVVLDPPAGPLAPVPAGVAVHLAWGGPERRFAEAVHRRDWSLREPLRAAYLAARELGSPADLPAPLAARCLLVLEELGLVRLDGGRRTMGLVPGASRVDVERSDVFRRCEEHLHHGLTWLSDPTALAA